MPNPIAWLPSRNRLRLQEALARAQFPTFAGTLREGLAGIRYTVPDGDHPAAHQIVELVWGWDWQLQVRCTCRWSQQRGPFTGQGDSTPCDHALVAWFYTLPHAVQATVLRHDEPLDTARWEGLDRLPPDEVDPRY